ncbi:MAG: glutamate synthase central domain-containing protein, partial [Chloroflexota bacterium]
MRGDLKIGQNGLPPKQGLYDPSFEHDACGVGFVVNIKGKQSHQTVKDAITVLLNLDHRGAVGAEPTTGDGAGILTQLPHKLFQREFKARGITLPEIGQYGVGMIYLPPDDSERQACEARLEAIVEAEGQVVLGWRTVPTDGDASNLGKTARLREPVVRQIFIGRNEAALIPANDGLAFERKLYVIRRLAEKQIRWGDEIAGGDRFYVPSLSARTIIYKGMLMPEQVDLFYPDLKNPDFESALGIVHSRFSTNTFPSWERAHPYRYLIHNGEINTVRGNINWMHARQSTFASDLFGDDLQKLLPIVDEDGSDSAVFDNCLEFLSLTGRTLPHAAMMMIPEPWSNHQTMSDEKKAFYEYHSCLMEPWDGPASIAFTDGTIVCAVLDRNGLRPSRYYITQDEAGEPESVIMASEVGVLEVPPERVLAKKRLEPGRMFLIDTAEGRIISDEELKQTMAMEHPYREWLDEYLLPLDGLPAADPEPALPSDQIITHQQAFGYTFETLRMLVAPMAQNSVEALGAMGDDTPAAVLSNHSKLLYSYFRQLFAQVTNPPLDAIREELVTASEVMMGTEINLLDTTPQSCHQIKLNTPVLTNAEMAKIRHIDAPGFESKTLSMLFDVEGGVEAMEARLQAIFAEADAGIKNGINVFILSDRGITAEKAAIPALLVVSGLHHHLIREET